MGEQSLVSINDHLQIPLISLIADLAVSIFSLPAKGRGECYSFCSPCPCQQVINPGQESKIPAGYKGYS